MSEDKKEFEELTEEVKKVAKEAAEELASKLEETKESLEEIFEEIDFEEKYKEALATMENLRKRVDNERVDFMKYRAASFIESILPTIDMFELAINAENISDEVKNWLVGFEMILKNFKTVLEAEGVVEIKVNKNDEFNGNIHHAIEEREDESVTPGNIIEVKQKGYKLHDRLLRPAAVVVAKENKE